MAKKAYIGVGGTARKVKKIYIGVGGIARKVKKAYIGVGGVARPCFGEGVTYYGTTTPLSQGRGYLAATTVGDYALFGGGYDGSARYATVDVYNKSLIKTTATDFDYIKEELAATTVGNYAIFAGGYYQYSSALNPTECATVDVYNNSLTKQTFVDSLETARHKLAATTVGSSAIFAGGQSSSSGQDSPIVDLYTESLTHSYSSSIGRYCDCGYDLAATTVGNYALFGGGTEFISSGKFSPVSAVNAYDASLTKTNVTEGLSVARRYLAATTVGDYALFGGGSDGSALSSVVDVFDTALTRVATTELSTIRSGMTATTIGDYALFGGGWYSSAAVSTVDVFDASLTRKVMDEGLSVARRYLASTTVGNYALFGGGYSTKDTVDVYTV